MTYGILISCDSNKKWIINDKPLLFVLLCLTLFVLLCLKLW